MQKILAAVFAAMFAFATTSVIAAGHMKGEKGEKKDDKKMEKKDDKKAEKK